MIEVHTSNFSADTKTYRWYRGTGISYYPGATGQAYFDVPQAGTPSMEVYRHPADYLEQGPSLGCCHNNAVENFQVKGKLVRGPATIGSYSYFGFGKQWLQSNQFAIGSYSPTYIPTGSTSLANFHIILDSVKERRMGSHQWRNGVAVATLLAPVAVSYDDIAYYIPLKIQMSIGSMAETSDGRGIPMTRGGWSCTLIAEYGRFGSSYTQSSYWVKYTQMTAQMLRQEFLGTGPYNSREEVTEWLMDKARSLAKEITTYIQLNPPQKPTWLSYDKFSTFGNVFGPIGELYTPDWLDQLIYQEREILRDSFFNSDDRSLLAGKIVEDYNAFSSNLLAYVSDLGKTGDTIRTLLKLPRDIKNPKAWAKAWLSGRYGDRLAVSDTKELLQAVATQLKRGHGSVPSRARETKNISLGPFEGNATLCAHVFIADDSHNAVETAINNLMRWDAWPTLENVWDMVPLSFVVDWVLPVQKILAQIDSAVQTPYLKVVASYCSERNSVHGTFASNGCICDVELVYYRRYRHNALADMKPFTVRAELPSFSVIHLGDALALLVNFHK